MMYSNFRCLFITQKLNLNHKTYLRISNIAYVKDVMLLFRAYYTLEHFQRVKRNLMNATNLLCTREKSHKAFF